MKKWGNTHTLKEKGLIMYYILMDWPIVYCIKWVYNDCIYYSHYNWGL